MSLRKNISYVLFPLTIWYAVGVRFRNMLYAVGIKKQEAPHVTTIGVGNLSTGGTGKTPHVEYLLRLLSDQYATAMLSRGYKRKSKGYQIDDGSHDYVRLGDEPAMIARKFPKVQVAVCENRVEGVRQLMSGSRNEESGEQIAAPQLIVLDDVFQHRAIKPSLNILLTEYDKPFFRDHILPFGDLREFRKARYQANIVIVTKSPAVLNPIDKHNFIQDLRLLTIQKVFFSYLSYGDLQPLNGDSPRPLKTVKSALVVTGIAHPEPMVAEIKRHCSVEHLRYADHHQYTVRDIVRIKNAFDALPNNNKAIITTEKDAIRLANMCEGLPVYTLPVTVSFHKDGDNTFDSVVESAVRENISFLSKLSIWS